MRATDLLDAGVDIALTIQQPGQLVIGGPGTAHGVRTRRGLGARVCDDGGSGGGRRPVFVHVYVSNPARKPQVVQHGTTFAVAVNLCELDLLHLSVRLFLCLSSVSTSRPLSTSHRVFVTMPI